MNPKLLVVLNIATLVLMLFANYASNTGLFANASVAEISHLYDTLFAPAGYAFIIWGIIFLQCIGFVIYQCSLLKTKDPKKYISRTGLWFSISNIANALWLICWTNEQLGWSVVLIFLLLFCLCKLTINLRLELDDEPALTIFFVWWPVVVYLGWIMVATIACTASWLVFKGWHGGNISEANWAIIMIIIATVIYLLLIKKRNLREAALVGVWAFVAIAVRQWDSNHNVAIAALAAALVLFITSSVHGFINRRLSVMAKMQEGVWK